NVQNGSFIALDAGTGKIVYTIPTSGYSWSSPVGFLDPDDRMYILTGDSIGNIYLIDGLDGTIVVKRKVGCNFESSPVVVGNSAVVGSRINGIYKLSIE
ncbi:MAG: PQQ-like beta-propeller repeat protein, partial [Muribaculaceae bacterium]|nr:PQQ-like beta-propeller repeat protein [Muribaculaceae bacterium]